MPCARVAPLRSVTPPECSRRGRSRGPAVGGAAHDHGVGADGELGVDVAGGGEACVEAGGLEDGLRHLGDGTVRHGADLGGEDQPPVEATRGPSAMNPSWNVTVPWGVRASKDKARKTSGGTPSSTSPGTFRNPNLR